MRTAGTSRSTTTSRSTATGRSTALRRLSATWTDVRHAQRRLVELQRADGPAV